MLFPWLSGLIILDRYQSYSLAIPDIRVNQSGQSGDRREGGSR